MWLEDDAAKVVMGADGDVDHHRARAGVLGTGAALQVGAALLDERTPARPRHASLLAEWPAGCWVSRETVDLPGRGWKRFDGHGRLAADEQRCDGQESS